MVIIYHDYFVYYLELFKIFNLILLDSQMKNKTPSNFFTNYFSARVIYSAQQESLLL